MVVPAAAPKSSAYKRQAQKLLYNAFPLLSCAIIKDVLEGKGFDFVLSYNILNLVQAGNIHQTKKGLKVFLKKERRSETFRVTNSDLLDEMQSIPSLKNTKGDNTDDEPAAPNNKKNLIHVEIVECGCCFGDFPSTETKTCNANNNPGHNVCNGCIKRYVCEQLDGNNSTNFRCIVDSECGHQYDHIDVLLEVISPTTIRRIEEKQFRDNVENTKFDGIIWTCPKCTYMGYLDEEYANVNCHECKKTFCTKCDRVWHNNQTCEEVAAEERRLKDPILQAHEAMNEATIRRCPECSLAFVKHDGCNKMKCVGNGCKTLSCYLCGLKIKGYSHFCNCHKDSPCSCGKQCKLWTSTADMNAYDRKARHEAGKKVLMASGKTTDEIISIIASPRNKNDLQKKVPPPRRARQLPAPAPRRQVPLAARREPLVPVPRVEQLGNHQPLAPVQVPPAARREPLPPVLQVAALLPLPDTPPPRVEQQLDHQPPALAPRRWERCTIS